MRNLGRVRTYLLVHPRVTDWIVVAVYWLTSLLGIALAFDDRGLLVLATLLTGLALLPRRRYPLAVAAVVGLLGVLTILVTHESAGLELAGGVAVYTVAAQRRPAVAWTVLGGLCTVLAATAAVAFQVTAWDGDSLVRVDAPFGQVNGDRVASAVVIVLCLLVAFAIGTGVRSRRLHVADLIHRSEALAREGAQSAQLAAAQERSRIAREMHDVVAHSLTVMVALADGARALGHKDPALAGQALDELTETGRSALADMRRVLGVLREPGAGEDAPLLPPAAVPELEVTVETFRHAGLPVRIVRSGPLADLPPALRQAMHRIVTESLTNVLRYAPLSPAVQVVATLHGAEPEDAAGAPGESEWLEIVVRNTAGSGPSPVVVGTGRGILGMRERAALLGGTVEAGPTSTGWEVRAVLRPDDRPARHRTAPTHDEDR